MVSGVRTILTKAEREPGEVSAGEIGCLVEVVQEADEDSRRVEAAEAIRAVARFDNAGVTVDAVEPLLMVFLADDGGQGDSGTESEEVRKAASFALQVIGEKEPAAVESVIPVLRRALLDDSRESWGRKKAAQRIGDFGAEAPELVDSEVEWLFEALDDESLAVRKGTLDALGKIGAEEPDLIEEDAWSIIAALEDPEWQVRKAAAETVGEIGEVRPEAVEKAVPSLIDLLDDGRPPRMAAATALGKIGNGDPDAVGEAVEPLAEAVRSESDGRVIDTLGRIGDADPDVVADAVPTLVGVLEAGGWLGSEAAKALGTIGFRDPAVVESALEAIRKALTADTDRLRASAATALGEIGSVDPDAVSDAVDPLVRRLDDDDEFVRGHAAEALGRIGSADPALVGDAVDPLVGLLDDEAEYPRWEASRALGRIGREGPELVRPAVDPLQEAAIDGENRGAAQALGEIDSNALSLTGAFVDSLLVILVEGGDNVALATRALGKIGADAPETAARGLDVLVDLLERDHAEAAWAIGEIGRGDPSTVEDAVEPLVDALADEGTPIVVRRAAARALGKIGSVRTGVRGAVQPLAECLNEDDAGIRASGALALGQLGGGGNAVVDALGDRLVEMARSDENEYVRGAGAAAVLRSGLDVDAGVEADCADELSRWIALREDGDELQYVHESVDDLEYVREIVEGATVADNPLVDVLAAVATRPRKIRTFEIERAEQRVACEALGAIDATKANVRLRRISTDRSIHPSIREAAKRTLERSGTENTDSGQSRERAGTSRAQTGPTRQNDTEAVTATPAAVAPPPAPERAPSPGGRDLSFDDIGDLEYVGGGGTADVYRGTVEDLVVAVKQPRGGGDTMSAEFYEGFLAEARTWSKLDDNPYVVGVVDWGDGREATPPLPWIATEYMDGGTLRGRVDDLDLGEALRIGQCISDALDDVHHRGVAHLDLKPENVLFRTNVEGPDVPKVADWGIAQVLLEHTNSVAGITPTYAAPEQVDPETFGSTDAQTDIYQLGTVLYELVTGQPPFTGPQMNVVRAIADEEPDPPTAVDSSLPPAVDDLLEPALAKAKEDRYRTAAHFGDAIEELLGRP